LFRNDLGSCKGSTGEIDDTLVQAVYDPDVDFDTKLGVGLAGCIVD
jgi:hypothetical protein